MAQPSSALLATARAPVATASPTVMATISATRLVSPTQALQLNLAFADQEMNAARTSLSLQLAQQHAQVVIDIYVGAWGRWYGVTQVVDPAAGRGIFPGERVPGPAPDTAGAELPLGWGFRAYDMGDAKVRQAVEAVMGDVVRWRDDPRAGYDEIEAAVRRSDQGGNAINKLRGHGARAIAWARFILVNATSLDQAQQYASQGSQETGAALTAIRNLPQ